MLHPKIEAYCADDVVDVRGFDRCEFVSADEGRFEMRAYPGADCGNNIGTVHGGYLLALVDMAGAGAIDTLGVENATLSVDAQFLRAAQVSDEYLSVVGTVLKRGRKVCVSEVEITNPAGKLVMKATLTASMFDSKIIDLP